MCAVGTGLNQFILKMSAAIVQKWRAALASGEPFEAEARVRCADGTYRDEFLSKTAGGECCNVIELSRHHFEVLRNDDALLLTVGRGVKVGLGFSSWLLR